MATPDKNKLYFYTIISLSALGVAGIIAITMTNPKDTTVIVTLLGFLTPTVLAILAMMSRDTHIAINSRMTELLELTKKSSFAEGQLEKSKE